MTAILTAPLPPTAGMPEYQAYPIRYGLGPRSLPDIHADDFAALLEKKARHGYRTEQVFAEHLAPDGVGVVTPPLEWRYMDRTVRIDPLGAGHRPSFPGGRACACSARWRRVLVLAAGH